MLEDVAWSPAGTWLVYRTGQGQTGSGDILAIRPGVDSVASFHVASQHQEYSPAISRDGRWLAYSSNESGRHEVYVVPFPDATGGRWIVSSRGGTEPRWSVDGSELYYRDGAGGLVAVQVETDPTFRANGQIELFSAVGYAAFAQKAQYDVTPDGRFVMLRSTESPGLDEIVVVGGFFAELRERVAG